MVTAASINDLKANFKGTITEPGQDGYDTQRWSTLAEQPAQLVVYPKDAGDVSLAIRFATKHKLDIATKGGGHASGGQSSSEGLVIDFSKYMNGARIDPENKIAYVEGGCKTVTLAKLTIEHGLSAMLGMASQVGVIGHLIGGGLGLSVGERGLALDNLISAKVVLANGDIVTANEAEHSDLFWAIRGGGSNFGAIVEIAIKLHDQRRDVYSCTFVYAPEKLQDVFKEVIEWRKTQATDELIFLVLTLCPEGTPVLALNARKNSDFASGEASFSRFGKLAPLANMPCQIPYEDLCSLSDPYVANGFARVANSTYVKELTVDLAQQAWDAVMDVISKTSAKGSYVIFELGHFAKMASVPVGATAYAQRINSPLALIQVEYPKDVAGSVAEAEELVNKIKGAIDLAASTSETEGYGYPLFSDVISRVTDTDKYAKGIFGINYPRLQQVKAKYDPNMVFNKWFPIRPSA